MPTMLADAQVAEGRDRIRRVAERQTVERGLERVSVRSIAQELGWSATALYRDYGNRDAILAAARSAALDELSEPLETTMAGPGAVRERSREVGNAYVDLAPGKPGADRLTFALSQPGTGRYPELAAGSSRARRNMTADVEELVATRDPERLAHIVREGPHGSISLQMARRLDHGRPSSGATRRDTVRRLIHGARGTLPVSAG